MNKPAFALISPAFLRFSLVGAGGFAVDECVLWLMHYVIGLDSYSARVVSILCAMTFTWYGNRKLTFSAHAARGHLAQIAGEWLKFVIANSLGALINYGSYTLLVRFAGSPLSNPLLATALGVAIGLVFNFTLSKRFVFKKA